ncbi:hypothetical protein Tco_0956169 [Tanacetum coccineum]|uniref:Uncharacterized protein n=1 Tax=Tanacetum coccineum TaxID=301880 RepID=A0ABQ5E9A8_9ASTR
MIVLLLHLIRRRREEERINHLKQDQVEVCGGKEEDVGLDELGEGGKGVVSKIGELGGDICSELCEVLFGGGEGGEVDVVFDGAFGGVGDEEVVVGEGVVGTSSSLEMLTNNCLGGIIVNLIFLEGFEEEAFVEFMVEFG